MMMLLLSNVNNTVDCDIPLNANNDDDDAVFHTMFSNVNNTVDCDIPLNANDDDDAAFHQMFSNVNNTVDCDTPPNANDNVCCCFSPNVFKCKQHCAMSWHCWVWYTTRMIMMMLLFFTQHHHHYHSQWAVYQNQNVMTWNSVVYIWKHWVKNSSNIIICAEWWITVMTWHSQGWEISADSRKSEIFLKFSEKKKLSFSGF